MSAKDRITARFVASAPSHQKLPELGLPEVAFAGRSNVGKSSLLGQVLDQRKLVRTSRTPGRTQSLNLFVLDERLALVDLPGFGYAKLSKGQRAEMGVMVRDYVKSRGPLRGVLLLVDARREEVMPIDKAAVDAVLEAGRRVLVVITKCDLIPKPRRLHVTRAIERGLGVPQGSAIMCSSESGEGLKEVRKSLFEMLESA